MVLWRGGVNPLKVSPRRGNSWSKFTFPRLRESHFILHKLSLFCVFFQPIHLFLSWAVRWWTCRSSLLHKHPRQFLHTQNARLFFSCRPFDHRSVLIIRIFPRLPRPARMKKKYSATVLFACPSCLIHTDYVKITLYEEMDSNGSLPENLLWCREWRRAFLVISTRDRTAIRSIIMKEHGSSGIKGSFLSWTQRLKSSSSE